MVKKDKSKQLPVENCLAVSAIIVINLYTFNQAVIHAEFPAAVLIKSCSFLSVIAVGVFYSRTKDSKVKLSTKKIIIAVAAILGIVLFNFYKNN